ncbi:MAG: translation elongation factor Ts [Ureaplasma sp.]|nr:translation elongation factor Ts [Ureaplasma sp.]
MTKSELVKELRRITDAGMSDCIKALNETNDNIDEAVEWLRKNGAVKAAKKASAVAAEGLVIASNDKNKVAIVEVNCQTDFVAKNDKFINYANQVAKAVLDTKITNVDQLKINNKLVNEIGQDLTATIGEKIVTRRVYLLEANANQSVGSYTHMNNRIATAILVDGKCDEQVLKNVCMHIAAMGPKYLDKTSVDAEWLNKERKFLEEQYIQEMEALPAGKEKDQKLARKDAIIEGKIKKSLDEICLLGQKLVTEPSITVEQYLANNKVKAVRMENVILGDGIEKKVSNFVDEVAQQMKN